MGAASVVRVDVPTVTVSDDEEGAIDVDEDVAASIEVEAAVEDRVVSAMVADVEEEDEAARDDDDGEEEEVEESGEEEGACPDAEPVVSEDAESVEDRRVLETVLELTLIAKGWLSCQPRCAKAVRELV